jgi:hypothetical protein
MPPHRISRSLVFATSSVRACQVPQHRSRADHRRGRARRRRRDLPACRRTSPRGTLLLATGEVFRRPTTEGRPLTSGVLLMHCYIDRLQLVASHSSGGPPGTDRGAPMLRPPAGLVTPRLLFAAILCDDLTRALPTRSSIKCNRSSPWRLLGGRARPRRRAERADTACGSARAWPRTGLGRAFTRASASPDRPLVGTPRRAQRRRS